MSTNVERVLDQIRSLTAEEQHQVRIALNSPVTAKALMSEDEFEQHLLATGVISSIPSRSLASAAYNKRRAVEVKGKPVSETIIEERR